MAALAELKARSAAYLVGLLPAVKLAAEKLIERCYSEGVEIRLTAGYRSAAEQQRLYEQGRTKPGPIVTNAKPGQSNHNYGLAIDFVLVQSGYSMSSDDDHDGIADWAEVVAQAKLLGFSWGGDWITFKDYPHFEMMFGLSLSQLQAGIRPTWQQQQAVINRIQGMEESEEMSKVEELLQKDKEKSAIISALEQRIIALERRVNISLNQTPPDAYHAALQAAKAAGVMSTSNDKDLSGLKTIQILYNMGLFDPEFTRFINSLKQAGE
ncbi:M15 family metallopeptidase [Paenibacillus urinalis]|uniref:M15 family metallopeptidase n=1 Tax=Paenibacillus urinalis TaxID=521520 RepID=UPI0019606791